MALIDLFGITKRYDVKTLLENVDFHLQEGERIAVVGPNGSGKSTLLKIALGIEEPTEGKRVIDRSVQIEMLSQHPKFDATHTVREAIENELTELKAAKARYETLSLQVAQEPDNKALMNELEKTGAFLDHHNAWSLEDKIERVLQEFALKPFEDRLAVSLSGGEQRRVALASLILKKPDVLLLDEPSHHLDVESIEALIEELDDYAGALVIVTHSELILKTLAKNLIIFH
jgi:ATP-binding cassette subfamily F protein uup